ncbi:MAG TPA: hypothetical protein P5132_09655 [Bacteroidales bacterium]|nr:hypothetical protein [Bacteroidales bacterium]
MENFKMNLEDLKGKENPFSVPDGYFEDLPSRIQERIASGKEEHVWFLRFIQFVKPQFALAFMIIAFAVITLTTIDLILSGKNEAVQNNNMYTRIIEVDASEFSEQHFLDVLLEDGKKEDIKKQEEMDFYIHYLVDEDIDYATLIDEL